ncbi:hypothetical protein MUK42_35603 [Musa troglodytarum]|uniref:Uncharacterized protein n=1 Tax=Musa troglodytarum TaxID=320322 RepID=A0A9E7G4P9_9LILI|nr:hypothetical protein MUK42_35603 [Musa troglodytarum]
MPWSLFLPPHRDTRGENTTSSGTFASVCSVLAGARRDYGRRAKSDGNIYNVAREDGLARRNQLIRATGNGAARVHKSFQVSDSARTQHHLGSPLLISDSSPWTRFLFLF